MKLPKRLLLVLAAVAALAAPATPAAAAVWKHKGVNVTKHVEIGLAGAEILVHKSSGGAIQCEVAATLTTTGGSTGKITQYSLFGCFGTGAFAKCVPLATESKGLPWTVDVNATDLTITSMRIRRTFVGTCPVSEVDITMNPTVTLPTPTAIYEMEFVAPGTVFDNAGILQVKPPNEDTYGIG